MINWLVFTNKISLVGISLKQLGKLLLNVAIVISVVFFWLIVFIFYNPYNEIAIMMINLLRLGIGLFVFGVLIHYLFYFINEIVYKEQMKKVELKIKKSVKSNTKKNTKLRNKKK